MFCPEQKARRTLPLNFKIIFKQKWFQLKQKISFYEIMKKEMHHEKFLTNYSRKDVNY
jgi:hypothetical protein